MKVVCGGDCPVLSGVPAEHSRLPSLESSCLQCLGLEIQEVHSLESAS